MSPTHVRLHFPRRVRVEEAFIRVRDGCQLAARVWLPDDAEREPVPALLEYIPYRKNDGTAPRDAVRQPYYAGHGYAAVRVDLRGSGDSEGVLRDEYLPLEQEDGCAVIAWLAAQPWCSGAVGMIGKSWGGFNALQIAARRPPALRAIVTVCSTDDRYADDVHYIGGCLLASEMLPWASVMLAANALPPDPAAVGERWRALWHERLAETPPFVEEWLRHQRRDAYWRQGSVCEDLAAIDCAVYAVGGLADPYRNAIPRLLAGLSCPRKGLLGPWAHTYPDEGVPGPAIGFLQETLRFFDHWLKGADNGAMDGPLLRAWMPEPGEPQAFYAERPGRWVAEESWPSRRLAELRPVLAGAAETRSLVGDQAHGSAAGTWCPYGDAADLPGDQRDDDARALTYDSAPLAARLEILGVPAVELELEVDRPCALVAARLCDVGPDGSSLLVANGVSNLTHRHSHAAPAPCVPSERMRIRLELSLAAHAFAPGRRLRLALSPTSWPTAWPSPEPVRLTVHGVALVLPERPPRAEDERLAAFPEPETAEPLEVERLAGSAPSRVVERDDARGETRVVSRAAHDLRRRLVASGIELHESNLDVCAIRDGDPLSARVTSTWQLGIVRRDWRVRIETRSELWSDAAAFHVTSRVEAFEGVDEVPVSTRERHATVPRDLA